MIELLMPLSIIFEFLTAFANTCFHTGVIPGELKVTKMIPITKIAEPKSLNDYRPISISAKLMLLLKKLYYNRIQLYLEEKNVLSKYQFGFRKHLNTEMAMIALTDFLEKNLDQKLFCIVISLDFRKAFDTVPKELLLEKLKNQYNISVQWLRDYLTSREQYVDYDGKVSRRQKTVAGVPQGSIHGPILFSLLIDDLPKWAIHSQPGFFADDYTFAFVGHRSNMENLRCEMNTDLINIIRWSEENMLPLNERKTVVLVVSNHHNLEEIKSFSININEVTVYASAGLKCLELILDSELTWKNHITNLVKKWYMRIRAIYSVRSYLRPGWT